MLLEASDRVGGILRTDVVDGFRLDRGFQVLQTAYPEARACLDLDALDLRPFDPGAEVYARGRWRRLTDPLRRPGSALATLLSGVASPSDAVRVLKLRAEVRAGSLEELMTRPARTTDAALRERGFSERIIDEFFRPFYRGVFLEPDLATSSRIFEFTFRMFASGDVCLPAEGMEAIPRQLAARLAPGSVRTNTGVRTVGADHVVLDDGSRLAAEAVVVATGARVSRELCPEIPRRDHNAVSCLYYDAPAPPRRGPWLLLNGSGRGPISHLCVPSETARSYAPKGRSLVSVSVLGCVDPDDSVADEPVRAQLTRWFPDAASWRLLRVDRIPEALPSQAPADLEPVTRPVVLPSGVYVCGGHRETASIGGALRSGRRAAHAVLRRAAHAVPRRAAHAVPGRAAHAVLGSAGKAHPSG